MMGFRTPDTSCSVLLNVSTQMKSELWKTIKGNLGSTLLFFFFKKCPSKHLAS